MDILKGTPYELNPDSARRIIDSVERLQERVSLLRRNGALDDATLERLRKEWRFQQVHESAAIEGNALTLAETQIAIQRGITISGKPPEHSDEVRNLNDALDYLENLVNSKSPITEWEIRDIHRIILGREVAGSGSYRKIDVAITNSPHTPPLHFHVEQQMKDYADWLGGAESTQSIPVPLLAAVCHAWLVHIHPFRDGNGRTARAVMNLLLMRHGYPIVLIRKKDRQRYYEALRHSDDGDISSLVELVLDRCEDSLRQIDRIRTEVTGLSLAIQKVREEEERRYRIWAHGLELLESTIEDAFKKIERQDGFFRANFFKYDFPSFQDYMDLSEGSPNGNSWFVKINLERPNNRQQFLLWIGFASDEFRRMLGKDEYFPSIKFSVSNPSPPPQWILAGNFPSPMREISYINGKYAVLEQHTKLAVKEYEGPLALSVRFVADIYQGYFSG